ncbi:hypothetical protein SASPL_137424 [Salvia splendens]|uniref:Uncharacterized protein n=1 Tax=Salvia splendens TaxID=180675 RepID=A0A8X8WSV1_SALSN|nr:hypothetical protein SASPL_137424 [Salvia splendens]
MREQDRGIQLIGCNAKELKSLRGFIRKNNSDGSSVVASAVISDLPHELENDDKVGKLPYCCKDDLLLPITMKKTKAQAIFHMEVFKLPPDLNSLPQNWKITGRLNPNYKCGSLVRVDPSEFPDPRGIESTGSAIANWQVNCNMSRLKPKQNR